MLIIYLSFCLCIHCEGYTHLSSPNHMYTSQRFSQNCCLNYLEDAHTLVLQACKDFIMKHVFSFSVSLLVTVQFFGCVAHCVCFAAVWIGYHWAHFALVCLCGQSIKRHKCLLLHQWHSSVLVMESPAEWKSSLASCHRVQSPLRENIFRYQYSGHWCFLISRSVHFECSYSLIQILDIYSSNTVGI